jgi:hypothetical protein
VLVGRPDATRGGHRPRPGILALATAALLSAVAPAAAQESNHAAALLLDLIAASSVNATDTSGATPVVHQPHFLPGLALELAPRELNKALATQLTTFPLPSSAGGFAYTTDPGTGEIRPSAATFGPVFTERALTIGRRRLDFGLAIQSTSFSSFEGADLEAGDIKFVLQHNNCCPAANSSPTTPTDFTPEFERDLLQSNVSLDIKTNTTVLYANYGLTDRIDVGTAIPIVTTRIAGSVTSTILRTATAATPTTHSFDGRGLATLTAAETRSATGLGDILLRAKYNFVRQKANALAAAMDLRLPTGDKDDLLGTGATQLKLQLIGSGEYGIFAPHASFGYTFSNGDVSDLTSQVTIDPNLPGAGTVILLAPPPLDQSIPDEVNYTFGFSVAPHPRVTLGLDMIGRTIRNVVRFDVGNESFPNRAAGTLPTASYQATGEFLVRDEGAPMNLGLLLGVVGGKINIGRGLLVNTGVIFPLTDGGLKPKVTPYIGLDYAF